jgi:hypothetical protein
MTSKPLSVASFALPGEAHCYDAEYQPLDHRAGGAFFSSLNSTLPTIVKPLLYISNFHFFSSFPSLLLFCFEV